MSAAPLSNLFTDEKRPRKRVRCVVCGSERTSRVQVVVARVKAGRPVQGQMRAQSVPVCDEHAAELWARLSKLLP
jgi:hypothetical protein